MTASNRTQYIFGVYDPVSGKLLGVTPSGNTPYSAIPGSSAIVSTFAALRLQLGTQVQTVIATGKLSQSDGSGGTFVFNASDTTSGAWFVGTVAGSVLTVLSVNNGTLAVGQSVNRGDTGASIGTITSLGTGSGGTGTYNLSASATISQITFSADNNSTTLVGIDGSRWNLATTVSALVGPAIYGTDSGAVNAYVFTHSSTDPPATLAVGTVIRLTVLNTNTGASTLNADGTGAVAVIRANGSALTGGELSSLGPVVLQSTGTQWQIVSTAGAQPGYEKTASEAVAGLTVISGITQAASAVITTSQASSINPYSVGQTVSISGVVGMTQINGLSSTVTAIGGVAGAWTVTTNINSSAFSPYVSGGLLSLVLSINYKYLPYQVERHGALGSPTDDSVAVANCFATVPSGGVMSFQTGRTYIFSVAIGGKTSIIDGAGATASTTNANGVFSKTDHGNTVFLRNFNFTGANPGFKQVVATSFNTFIDYIIQNCTFTMNSAVYGVFLSGSREGMIRRCQFYGTNSGNGLYATLANFRIVGECYFENLTQAIFDDGQNSGFSTGIYLINSEVLGCTHGVTIDRCQDFYITGCTIDFNNDALVVSGQVGGRIANNLLGANNTVTKPAIKITVGSDTTTVSQNIRIVSNTIQHHNTGNGTVNCIELDHVTYCGIGLNDITFYTLYGIQIGANCDHLSIGGNSIQPRPATGTNAINAIAADNNTNHIWENYVPQSISVTNSFTRDNQGFTTRNGGSATILNTNSSVVVSHGCSYTPAASDIFLTLETTMSGGGQPWVDTITSTQFTIHTPAAVTANVTFTWRVDKLYF